MRLLQLAVDSNGILDLHPNVSIVTGLDDENHALLLDAVVGLARSEAVSSPGLLEAHGVLFDLDEKLLRVIGECPAGLDPVIRPSQLPAPPATVEARALRAREHDLALLAETNEGHTQVHLQAQAALAAATEALEEARRALDEGAALARSSRDDLEQLTQRCVDIEAERPRLVAELDEARSRLVVTDIAVAAVAHDVAASRSDLEEMGALRSSLEADLAEVGALDSGQVRSEVDDARGSLQKIEVEVEAEVEAEVEVEVERTALEARSDDGSGDDTSGPAVERLEGTDARIAELERLLSVITPVERIEVEQAHARLAGPDSGAMVASVEANQLADEIDRVVKEIEALDPDATRISGDDLSRGRTRLDEAHQALLEAERAARAPALDTATVDRLEDVHERLNEATDAPRRGFGAAKRPVAPIEELRAEEQEILDQLGFASYPAYVMGYSLHGMDPQLEAAVEAARLELSTAETEWTESERLTELALTRAALLDQRRVLLEKAHQLLGHPPADGTAQEALRGLRVPGESAATAAATLCEALEAVGIVVGDEELDSEELLELASAWLTESDRVDTRRHEARSELEEMQARRSELVAQAEVEIAAGHSDLVAAAESSEVAEERRLERIGKARGVLAAAEQRLADSLATAQRRDSITADLAAARDLEQAALQTLITAEASLSAKELEHRHLIEGVAAMDEELDRAGHEVADIRARIEALAVGAPDPEVLGERLAVAAEAHATALITEDEARGALEDARGRMVVMDGEVEALRGIVGSTTTASEATPAEEVEWYLLARLAAQRSVSVAGSVPVLLDDALRGLAAEDVPPVLDGLERMAEAVQVIIVSEDPVVAAWATSVGIRRAAVVGVTAG